MTQEWKYENATFRRATAAEIKTLQDEPGAPHVLFGCSCGKAAWSAKNLALSSAGHYNGARNIFYIGEGSECSCPSIELVCIVEA